ncbi:MAG: tRNA (adenosine(37)-N6)-threonylcarbamoyltransferase complex dimerization subunit type 1 TsaB [Candidatus Saccharibacteria bacterium]|jgi:tRNA threonylcarbamoyladenosine biosynthesis protein TsaB|nr:MAG: tRNA (adenosine(37)-N6)-threonylcarbamoyltransferase complex dimerization subunit type 1 TsaB [Candidatus Saccharibacteria bacterium]
MILLLDTSTPVCKLTLVDGDWRYDDQWQADRQLAKGLLQYLQEQLQKNGKTFQDITAIGAFTGPGSFTGLRIGLTVLNTIADSEKLPIVGAGGENWQSDTLARLQSGENDQIVLPFYGGDAHITKPRK